MPISSDVNGSIKENNLGVRSTYVVQGHGGLGECGKECGQLDVRVLLTNNETGMYERRSDE